MNMARIKDVYVKAWEKTKELSEEMKLEPNASGMRLLNLYKKRLVKRVETIQDGGKVWSYERI